MLIAVAAVLPFGAVLLGAHAASSAFGTFAVMSGAMSGRWLKERRARLARAAVDDSRSLL